MKRIAIVEDELLIREELARLLSGAGYEIQLIEEFDAPATRILELAPDLALLDINLPGESGFEILRQLKSRSAIPVLALTSRERLSDELLALRLGADEYITKPFRAERLLARAQTVLKRYEGRPRLLERANFLLDPVTYTLYVNGSSTLLPQTQGRLLEALLKSPDAPLSHGELCRALWGTEQYIDENALRVNVARLKRLLNEAGAALRPVSVRGVGYTLEAAEAER